jgi:hydrophobe/amphiphile efflux-1 (HAE1) family protein
LPVSPLPQVEFPVVRVYAGLPGASPEVMASAVATPLERQLGHIAGVTQMTSNSGLGVTNITMQFDLSRNIDGAARDVQAAINAARGQLPADLPSIPTYHKVNPADAPIAIVALTSNTYTRGQIYDVASNILAQKLSQVEGVGEVYVGGGASPGVRVELNPTALNQYGIGLEAVRTALATANVNQAKGQLDNGVTTAEIVTNDQIYHAYQYKPLVIAYKNNAAVKLADVARVEDAAENLRRAGISQGKPAVMLVMFKQPGSNIIKVVDRIKSTLPQLKAAIPAAIDMEMVMDRTTIIRASVHDVEITLLIATVLVILVVYAFLRNIRTALIPMVSVPLSLLGTFGVMYLLGYSLDNLSLMALTIATGFVVDDAVVVLENTERHIEEGMQPLTAAILGAKEVGFTVLSMSISLVAVFTPILCMTGIVGRLFREFAMTLSIAIFISLLVSLTVTPMMCARVLRPKQKLATDTAEQPVDLIVTPGSLVLGTGAQDKTESKKGRGYFLYARSLHWALDHSRLMLLITVGAIALSIYLFTVIPKGFFPQQDTGRINASIQGDQSISFQSMEQKLKAYVKIVSADPAVQSVEGFIGNGSTNSGSLYISLKPLAERNIAAEAVIGRLREKLSKVPNAKLYMQVAQDLVIGGRQGNAQFQYTLSANSLADLNEWVPKVMQGISKLPGIADVNSDQMNHGLQVLVNYDHDTAARLGLNSQLIDNTLYDAFGQRQVAVMYATLNQYHVVMEVAPEYWQRPETLKDIYVTSNTGQQVPLSTFATYAPSAALLEVNHQNQFPSATLSFNLLPGVPLGDVVERVEQLVEKMHLPATIQASFQGTAQAFQASLSSQPWLILLALAAVYIVLGILYESLVHPITILSTLPSAGAGALLALFVTRTDLNIIAMIGIILLIGIVKKNAIMMIDFALQLKRSRAISSYEAIYQAALLRVRPIMMTTVAAMLGALPLAIGLGAGSELRKPLGITIIGGLIVSQLLTLYTTPVIYLTMERVAQWRRR